MEITIKCAKCQRELSAVVSKNEIFVDFCDNCAEEICKASYGDGNNDGYELGFTERKSDGLKEGEQNETI